MTSPVPDDKLRLGGMALRNGLLVHGPTHWAAAVRTDDGELKVASGRKPDLGGKASERLPGIRGVVKLAEAMAVIPLVKRELPEARLPMQDLRTLGAMGAAALGGQAIRTAGLRKAGTRTAGREAAVALVISSTGFFPDGKWHGMAKAMREPGTGEQLVDGLDRDGFGAVMHGASSGMTDEAIEEYWKAYADDTRRRGQLELYRSGDFAKLEGYDLAALGVPTLLLWGEDDEFAPVAGAHRFQRELADTELVVVDGARHFVWEDAPAECAEALTGFLARVRG